VLSLFRRPSSQHQRRAPTPLQELLRLPHPLCFLPLFGTFTASFPSNSGKLYTTVGWPITYCDSRNGTALIGRNRLSANGDSSSSSAMEGRNVHFPVADVISPYSTSTDTTLLPSNFVIAQEDMKIEKNLINLWIQIYFLLHSLSPRPHSPSRPWKRSQS
jgi:hypothetical protein